MHRILSFILLFLTISSYAQQDYEAQQRQLEERKASILKEIKEYQTLLNTNKKQERNILAELNEQNKKIKLQTELINNSNKQVKTLGNDIYVNTIASNKLRKELAVLKDDYAKTIVKSYKSRSEQNRIMFILSSENFLQAYKRMQYIKQYAKYRKSQGDEIRSKFEELERISAHLEVQKRKKEQVANEQEGQRKVLQEDKNKQSELMSLVQKDSKKYSAQIKNKQQETKKIDQQIKSIIKKIIEEENRKRRKEEARKKREEEARNAKTGSTSKPTTTVTKTSSSGKFDLTPAEKALATSFSNNRGSLPWPVEKGYISLGYGDQPHPEYPSLTIHNSGIEISTEKGASVRSVFEGEVMNIQVIGNNKAVFIRHGEYITVYQNLASTSVSKGQKVSTKQKIGTVGTNHEGKSILKFVLTKNESINNPQSWLSGR
ncbi:peptidoglycan DD-metalloendopeptidase family protein [Flavobacterium sp. xlx-214]|uniref:murein hydrolase activator EnvC family protein n=1 Tax=unclassified Flavobacterium TaxID=196869 RepID=UPI0013D04BAE|nr:MULTISPECIES: peptidoglycan DD-metalloendopeptidase family protein [unclassified Flavobacterium]MBA5792161.1 peptidoglycan DD-metalloendopeptidase family protein [Flavobacterium sp. xlx-221]QMI84406.1 peptidoglycan DD-metalloendopeptidase family protein [Flavobacterium sp. xlx-214]